MFSPLSLRICCLAAMAPALSNEKTVRENNNNNNNPTSSQLIDFPTGRPGQRRRGRSRKTQLLNKPPCLLSLGVAQTGVSLKSVLTDANSKTIIEAKTPKPGDLYQEHSCDCAKAHGGSSNKGIECAKMMSSSSGDGTSNHNKRNDKQLDPPTKPQNNKITKSLGVVKNSRSAASKALFPGTAPESTNGTNALQQVKDGGKRPEIESDSLLYKTHEQSMVAEAEKDQELTLCKTTEHNNSDKEVVETADKDIEKVEEKQGEQINILKVKEEQPDTAESFIEKDITEEKEVILETNDTPLLIKKDTNGIDYGMSLASTSASAQKNKPLPPIVAVGTAKKSKELLENESGTRQKDLETKAECLYKRLRRLQSRQGLSHCRNQLTGLVDHQRKHPQSMARSPALDIKEAKDLSTSALVNLVHVWQSTKKKPHGSNSKGGKSSQGEQRLLDEAVCGELNRVSGHLSTNLYHLQKSLDSDATESSSGGESGDEGGDYDYDWGEVSKPAINKRCGWRWARERAEIASRWTWLQAQVSDLEYRIRQQNEIYKQIRQSKGELQLGDMPSPTCFSLETILKLGNLPTEVEDKLLELQRSNEASPANVSSLLSNLERQSATVARYLRNVFSPLDNNSPVMNSAAATTATTPTTPPDTSSATNNSVPASPQATLKGRSNNNNTMTPNGLLSNLNTSGHSSCSTLTATPGSSLSSPLGDLMTMADSECQAARCRPLRTEGYRKRKLLRTSGTHLHSRKAARLSDVRCQCYPPTTPCALCGGRYNYAQQGVDSEVVVTTTTSSSQQQVPERIALLDHSYHQVLSFEQDVPLSIHFEGILKTGAWQRHGNSRSGRTFHLEKRKGQYQIKEKKGVTKRVPPKSASAAVLSRIKNKYEVTRALSSLPQSPDKKRLSVDLRLKKKKAALNAIDGRRSSGRMGARSQSDSSLPHRDTPSPSSSHTLREVMRRKQTESAYDINNIVIPYSIAASTRVEKLQYKEIMTPSWREVTTEDGENVETSESAVVETPKETQVSDQTVDTTKAKSVMQETVVKEEIPPVNNEGDDTAELALPTTGEDLADLEDMSDETYSIRHHRHELDERKKFAVVPANQRRRSRPSRAESESLAMETPSPGAGSGAINNTNSVPYTLLGCEATPGQETSGESIAATPPSTPNAVRKSMGEDQPHHHHQYYCEDQLGSSTLSIKRSTTPVEGGGFGNVVTSSSSTRLRTSSVSSNHSVLSRSGNSRNRSLSHSEERAGINMHHHQHTDQWKFPSWPERNFPLNEDDYQSLFEEKPVDKYSLRHNSSHSGLHSVHIEKHGVGASSRLGYYFDDDEDEMEDQQQQMEDLTYHHQHLQQQQQRRSRHIGRPPSPGSSTSTATDEEDQNDPEWTVHKVSGPRKAGIVLKIAKR